MTRLFSYYAKDEEALEQKRLHEMDGLRHTGFWNSGNGLDAPAGVEL